MAGGLSHSLEGAVRLYDSRLNAPQEVHIHVSKVDDIELFDSSRGDGLVVRVLIELLDFGIETINI